MEEVLQKHGFTFKKRYGQNFLTDPNLLRAIVSDAGVGEESVVLEIGAGAGALTRALSERAKRVVSYEIDSTLRPVLAETLAGCDNTEVVFRDFLREDLGAVEAELGAGYLVVANLPYYVTTPLLMKLVEEGRGCAGATVMVQEEVARRLCAAAGTADYGAVTAAIARRGGCSVMRTVPRSMFHPRPNVDSAVVKADFTRGGFPVESEWAFRETVRCAFGNRRKTLVNNLMHTFRLPREEAEEILASLGVVAGARGETLPPSLLGALSDELFRRGRLGREN